MSRMLILALHFAGLFGFLLAHGTSAALALSLRREREPSRMRRLLESSEGSFSIVYLSLLVVLATGMYGAFTLGYWRSGWLWTSLGLLLIVIAVMWTLGGGGYSEVRKPLGIRYRVGFRIISEPAPVVPQEAEQAAERQRPWALLTLGVAALAAFLYLMIWKPF